MTNHVFLPVSVNTNNKTFNHSLKQPSNQSMESPFNTSSSPDSTGRIKGLKTQYVGNFGLNVENMVSMASD